MLKIKLPTILLCLGLSGYTYAANEIYGAEPSLVQEAREVVFLLPDYNLLSGQLVLSDHFATRTTIAVSKLFNLGTDCMWSGFNTIDARILRCLSEYMISFAIAAVGLSVYKKNQKSNADSRPLFNRLLILQHFRFRELDWRLYSLVGTELGIDDTDASVLVNPMFWFYCFSISQYILRGKAATRLPYLPWGGVAWIPCYYWLNNYGCHCLDNYISYREKTFLIGLSTDMDKKHSLFFKTDTLYSYKRYILDIEAGVGFDCFPPTVLGFLMGLQGRFRLNERFSLNITLSYKQPSFLEGVAATDGFIVNGGFTVHNFV
ncbi:MAG: hypothetical protein AAF400_01445 [Bacteroidota bacterium]